MLEQNWRLDIFSPWMCSRFECSFKRKARLANTEGSFIWQQHCPGLTCVGTFLVYQFAALSKCVRHSISREEGLAALWKGHLPAQVLSVTYGFVRCQLLAPFVQLITFHPSFAAFEAVVPLLGESDQSHAQKFLTHMVGGGIAGASGTLASAPGDVLRTRLVAQAEPVYKSIWHAITQLWKEGGVPAFYKGALPAVMMTAPQAALQFAFYSLFTSLVPKVPLKDRSVSISIPESLSCGGLAGMASKSLLYPLDVAKKRLQVDKIPKGTPKLFSGL